MGRRYQRLYARLHSRQGKNFITFLVFLVISTVLWIVMALNEDTQRDLRCGIRIVNVPDSLTRISPMPEAINISVRAKGSQLMKYWWTKSPMMTIDYRQYKSGNKIQFSEASMKAFFRSIVGGGSAQILSVSPDSLSVSFTSQPGIKLPVKLEAHVTAAPQHVIVGKPHLQGVDSVTVFSTDDGIANLKYICTKMYTAHDLRKSQTAQVPLRVPEHSRLIPDSVEIAIEVEPLISKSRRVPVVAVNVPSDLRLIAVPSQVEVYYMVPMSIYKKSESDPKFRVEVDYNDIEPSSDRLAVNLVYAPKDFTNVFLSTDSIDFIIEQK